MVVAGGGCAPVVAPVDLDHAACVLSLIELRVGDAGPARRRTALFVATSRLAADAAQAFHLPRDVQR